MAIKKSSGWKRHIVVVSLGHLLQTKVHAANESDTFALVLVLEETVKKNESIKAEQVMPDIKVRKLMKVNNTLNMTLHIWEKLTNGESRLPFTKDRGKNFRFGKRTFRRLFKDVEILADTAKALKRIANKEVDSFFHAFKFLSFSTNF